MARLAAVRSRHRLHALRPPPAGLEGEARCAGVAHSNDVDPGLVRRTRLVGGVEGSHLYTGHRSLLWWVSRGEIVTPSPDHQRRDRRDRRSVAAEIDPGG